MKQRIQEVLILILMTGSGFGITTFVRLSKENQSIRNRLTVLEKRNHQDQTGEPPATESDGNRITRLEQRVANQKLLTERRAKKLRMRKGTQVRIQHFLL